MIITFMDEVSSVMNFLQWQVEFNYELPSVMS